MLSAIKEIKNLVKSKSYHIDYPLFRLHYQLTAGLILAYCILLGGKVFFGDVIECRSRNEQKGKADFYDNICFAQGTYTQFQNNVLATQKGLIASNGANGCPQPPSSVAISDFTTRSNKFWNWYIPIVDKHDFFEFRQCYNNTIRYILPGIPIPSGRSGAKDENLFYEKVFRHQYYQYIPILLFLQAAFFYLPHHIWKIWEHGVVSSICKELYNHRQRPLELVESIQVIKYIKDSLSRNKSLVYKYYFCQALTLVNLIGQTFVLDWVFNYKFITYGLHVFYFKHSRQNLYGLQGPYIHDSVPDQLEFNNPMDHVFPKFTACTVELLAMTGDTEISQFLCVLTLNVFNDKFFLILWCWFLVLAILTTFQIIFDMLYLILPSLQRYLFGRKFAVQRSLSLPELFLLDLIGCNSEKYVFVTLLQELEEQADETPKSPKSIHSLV